MIILALDLGTNTGFCYGDAVFRVSGAWNFRTGRHEGGGMRYLKFRQKVDSFFPDRLGAVFYEEVRRHTAVDAAHVYGGLLATLTSWCEENKIPYTGVPVGTIKKFATGRGNAGKAEMIVAARRWGVDTTDDNEADAVAIHAWALKHGGIG